MKYIGVNSNKYDLRESSKKGFDFLHVPVTITSVRKAKSFARVRRKAYESLARLRSKGFRITERRLPNQLGATRFLEGISV